MKPYIIFPIYLIRVIFQLDLREQAFPTERYLLGGFSAVNQNGWSHDKIWAYSRNGDKKWRDVDRRNLIYTPADRSVPLLLSTTNNRRAFGWQWHQLLPMEDGVLWWAVAQATVWKGYFLFSMKAQANT